MAIGMRLPDFSPKKPKKSITSIGKSTKTRVPNPARVRASNAAKKKATTSKARSSIPKAPARRTPSPTVSYKAPAGATRNNYASTSPVKGASSSLGKTSSGSYSGISTGGYGGGRGGGGIASGGGGGGGVAVQPTPPPEPKPPSEKDWLKDDRIYGQEQKELEASLRRLRAEYGYYSDGDKGDWNAGRLQNQYQTDFDKNLRDLGWDANANQWDQANQLGSYGSAFNNQLEDYAGRGMLDSSAYMQALSDLNRGFDDQLGAIRTGRENYISDLQNQYTDQYSTNQDALARARMDSLMRRAAEFNLPFSK